MTGDWFACRSWWVIAAVLIATPLSRSRAHAQDKWLVNAAAQGVDQNSVSVFEGLLRDDLHTASGAETEAAGSRCRDAACVRVLAAERGAQVSVHATVARLGTKLIASATATNVQDGTTRSTARIAVSELSELDIASTRIAKALVSGETVDDTAQLGSITQEEERLPTRRDNRVAVELGMEMLLPTRGFAEKQPGAGIDLGVWVETNHFYIEPRVGVRFDLADAHNDYVQVPVELGLGYIVGLSDITPVFGAGVGLAFVHERMEVSSTTGSFIVTTTHDEITEFVVGPSVYARAGLLFLRTYDVSLLAAVDYAVTFADFHDRSDEQTLRFGVYLLMGGT